ncbi:MAG TPA: hypothetical protein VFG45_11205 [Candidatus Nitrosocosmicus sp.]|nr:hypothetical protein [Candidatus Nitrosocosmicus sp.]
MEEPQNKYEFNIWTNYLRSLRSLQTREKYQGRMKIFFDFIETEGIGIEEKSVNFAKEANIRGTDWAFNRIYAFISHLISRVEHKEIVGSTVQNYVKSIKLFCELADIQIPWKKLTRGLPKSKSYANDRIPTEDELYKLMEYPDRRLKAIIYTMTSSGIRLGAWNFLRWGDVEPVNQNGKVVAAKLKVYSGEEEQYLTFITDEAYFELETWMNYRSNSGEEITQSSWVMRDLWNTDETKNARGLVKNPKKLSDLGVKRLIERALWAQGVRTKNQKVKKRYPFAAVHSLRKWLKTKCEIAGMRPINIEKILSHDIGISNSYYRPTDDELLQDYLKVSNALILDKETRIQTKLKHTIKEKDDERNELENEIKNKDQLIYYLEKKHQDDVDSLKKEMSNKFERIVDLIRQNHQLINVKPEVLGNY